MVLARPFAALRARSWEPLDHLQPRSKGFEAALESAADDLADRVADGRLAPTAAPGAALLWLDELIGGTPRRTAGIILDIDVLATGDDAVLPHEQVFPEPVARRVRTRNRLRTETVPSLVVLRDPVPALSRLLAEPPDPDLSLERGRVTHHVALLEPTAAAEVAEALAGIPALIADGHHRVAAAAAPDSADRGRLLAWLVAADHPPRLLPVHRALHGVPDDAPERLEAAGVELIAHAARPSPDGVVLVLPDSAHLLRPTVDGHLAALLAGDAPVVRDLPVTLGQHVLHDVLGLGTRRDNVSTTTSPSDAVGRVRAGTADATLLACGPTLEEVWEAALLGIRMPPKATWFAPKPLSGAVLRRLPPSDPA